jgi:uncharacterized protein YceK
MRVLVSSLCGVSVARATALAILLLLPSCGTIAAFAIESDEFRSPPILPGVRYDLHLLGGFMGGRYQRTSKDTSAPATKALEVVQSTLDLPFSLVADTLVTTFWLLLSPSEFLPKHRTEAPPPPPNPP